MTSDGCFWTRPFCKLEGFNDGLNANDRLATETSVHAHCGWQMSGKSKKYKTLKLLTPSTKFPRALLQEAVRVSLFSSETNMLMLQLTNIIEHLNCKNAGERILTTHLQVTDKKLTQLTRSKMPSTRKRRAIALRLCWRGSPTLVIDYVKCM